MVVQGMLHNLEMVKVVKITSHMVPGKRKCKKIVMVGHDATQMSDPSDL